MTVLRIWGVPLLLATLLSVAFWAYLGRGVELPPAPEPKLHCVSYTPFRGDQTPYDRSLVIPPAQIEEDLAQLQPITECVRIYATDQGLDQVVPLAAARGMQVLLGIWISSEPKSFEPQIEKAIELANAYPQAVKAIIVGNEVLLRGEQSGETLAALVTRVKAATSVPVTYADVWGFWQKAPQVLVDAVDYLTIHILPYWEDDPAPSSDAVVHIEFVMEEMARQFPGHRLMIGETGWPSAGRAREDAIPSIVDQARYLRDFLVYAKTKNLDYNFIEAFDQPWKRHQEGAVGGYWGVFDAERHAKFDWFKPVSNHPNWPYLAGIGILIGLGALGLARPSVTSLRDAGGYALGAMAAGALIVLQVERASLIYLTLADLAVETGLLLQALAVLLLALRGGTEIATAPLNAATRWLMARETRPVPVASLLRLLVLLGAATVALALAFDGRYRGFPLAAYAVPAAAFLLLQIRSGSLLQPIPDGREERALSVIFVGCALYLAWAEGPLNWQSLSWCGLLLVYTLNIAGAWRQAAKSGVSAARGA
nr:glycoside hydrolase [uncultured Dongia sp.]